MVLICSRIHSATLDRIIEIHKKYLAVSYLRRRLKVVVQFGNEVSTVTR
jgi:hypothetical protein